jgi:predicted dehydrogenase
VLKGAIVGFGEVARHGHWASYVANPDAAVVAVVDRSPERRQLAAVLDPALRTFETIADLAREMSIDFVDICTPPALHVAPMLEAIEHGWHVLCEKPFVLDRECLPAIRRAADEKGVAVVPVHNWKYADILRAASGRLEAGAIGRLTRVEIETHRMQAAPTADGAAHNWRHDPAVAGGGILFDHGWHAIYLVLHWFRSAPAPGGVHSRLEWPQDGGVEREASVTIEFPGGEASIFLTWNGSMRRNVVRLFGDSGRILVDDDTLHVAGRESSSTTFPSAISAGSHHADWFAAMLPDVLHCFRAPERSRPLFDEAVECLTIIDRAYLADASRALQSR